MPSSCPAALAALVAAAACLDAAAAAAAVAANKPNVLFIVSDDLRPELGCYGGEAITPALDKLAASAGAVVFDRAYVQQAICCPTRSSFLTGRRPDTTKVWDLRTHFRASGGAFTTLPELFMHNGYTTYGMGKIFHPVTNPANGDRDDDSFSWSKPYYHAAHGLGNNMTMCWTEDEHNADGNFTDTMNAQHGVKVLQNASADLTASGTPFFVAVGLHRPHLPWDVPARWYDLYPAAEDIKLADHNQPPVDYGPARQYSWDPQSGPRHCGPLKQMGPNASAPNPNNFSEYMTVPDPIAKNFRRGYFAAVSFMDHAAGIVLDELDTLGLASSTIVSFIGDHGWQLGDIGEFGKKTNFEMATRIPFILRVPPALLRVSNGAAAVAGRRSSALVEAVDIMPTLIELAGLPMPGICPPDARDQKLCREGQSLKKVLSDPAGTTGFAEAAFMQYAACMHDEGIWHDGCAASDEPKVMGYAMRTRRWRYIEWVPFNKTTTPPTAHWDALLGAELYDHTAADTVANVAEAVNLVARPSMTAIVAKLSAQLHAGWRHDIKLA